MLKFLVILLDDISIPFCHANNPLQSSNLMPIETLREAIVWSMKENLMVHYVLPPYKLPNQYYELLDSIDNIKIGRDVSVFSSLPESCNVDNAVFRLRFRTFIDSIDKIGALLPNIKNLNILYTDIETFNDNMINEYKDALSSLSDYVKKQYLLGRKIRINVLTNRIFLSEMNNCGAGISNVTIAPNGNFYTCPAFYYDEVAGISNGMNHEKKQFSRSVGSLENGLNIPNRQLLDLGHAPLCRECDAFHCHRCVWLNQKLTWDINTPSHQQCVISHIERNASRALSNELREIGYLFEPIKEIQYLDPFEYKLNN